MTLSELEKTWQRMDQAAREGQVLVLDGAGKSHGFAITLGSFETRDGLPVLIVSLDNERGENPVPKPEVN